MSSIGERIKKSRNDKGLSLRELASRVDLSASFLSQIEQGKASPSIENLKKIATSLDVKVSYLIEDEEETKNMEVVKKNERKYIESVDSNTKMALLTDVYKRQIFLVIHNTVNGKLAGDVLEDFILEKKIAKRVEKRIIFGLDKRNHEVFSCLLYTSRCV